MEAETSCGGRLLPKQAARLCQLALTARPCSPHLCAAFPYPIALTMWHMFFCAGLASLIIRAGYVEPVKMNAGADGVAPDENWMPSAEAGAWPRRGAVHIRSWRVCVPCVGTVLQRRMCAPSCPSASCTPAPSGWATPHTSTCQSRSSKCSRWVGHAAAGWLVAGPGGLEAPRSALHPRLPACFFSTVVAILRCRRPCPWPCLR